MPNSWYVYVLFFYYSVFACGRFLKVPKNIVFVMIGATISFVVFSLMIGLGDWWWKSNFAFNVGTFLPLLENKYRGRIDTLTEKKIVFVLFILLASCSIFNIFNLGFYKVRWLMMIMTTTVLPGFLYLVFRKIQFYGGKVLHFIGSISYEIYLVHGIVIILVRDFLDINSLLSLLIIYVLTFFFSWLISKLSQSIKIKILEN